MAWGSQTSDPFGGGAMGGAFGGASAGSGLTNGPVTGSTGGGFSSWSGDLFNTIGTLGTAFFNSKAGYPTGMAGMYGQAQYYPSAPMQRNNTILYVLGAVVLLVVLYIFLKR